MSVMLDNKSARLFQAASTVFQNHCHQIIDELLLNGLSENELNATIRRLYRSLEQIKRAGQMMAIDCPTNELVRVVPIGFFTSMINRPGQEPMTEFDWACIFTTDILNTLSGDFLRHGNPDDIVASLKHQALLWDLAVPFPPVIYHADDGSPPPYVNSLQISSPASFARMNSRIPVMPRPRPPVDTYQAYNRPVPGPYTPALPARPWLDFLPEYDPSDIDPNISGIYRRPSLDPR
ncbi:uncharacterized protein N7479_005641 [Penicillium vulpinum]|uniref:Uncharacterized protein n=1 Tax=Penicillium vulpinum TaxID=29845 RepID=A0A1V6SFU1_9EURO|nr:uncharacterized protein N7479_005641 [Penicillium vulpinum]KAJ5958491.1 hypothetical protein N7479_005641 [Penicillium vulpinum]OQE12433.1 hypothetical protein PENVUL_c001G03722 [Penicillium vulpinum]